MLFWVYFSDSQERNLSGYSQQTMDLSPITPDSPLCEPFYPPTQFILPDDPDDETIAIYDVCAGCVHFWFID